MPYVFASIKTGRIVGGPFYQAPSNASQIEALKDEGIAIHQVPDGISANNSFIDLNTGSPAPTGAPMTHIYRYEYDVKSGMLMGHSNGLIDNTKIPENAPGLIVLKAHAPELVGGMTVSLDKDGMPIKNHEGAFSVRESAYIPVPPGAVDLLILSAVNSGGLDPAHIPDHILKPINANLASVGIPTIKIKSASAAKPAS